MVGVALQYMLDSALRFDHKDFITAVKLDLGPILSDLGVWSFNCLKDQAKENGDNEAKKKNQTAIDLIEKFLESGLEVIGQEKKYYFINKFGPKKCPDLQVKRESIRHIYSWMHYAPQEWFEF